MRDCLTGYPYELGAEDPFAVPPAVTPSCPLCSGKVSREDPAAQALDWGIRVAESDPGADDYWKLLKAAEVYRSASQGGGGGRSDARDVMDEFVSGELDAVVASGGLPTNNDISHSQVSVMAEGQGSTSGWSTLLASHAGDQRGWWEDMQEWWDDVGRWEYILREKLLDTDGKPYTQHGQGDEGGTRSDPWPGPERCKVEVFWYPVWWRPFPPTEGWKASYYGFRFGAGLVYLDTPGLYDCSCCVFRQFRQVTQSTPSFANQALVQDESWTRDVSSDGKEYGGGRGGTDPKKDDPAKERGRYYGESECIFYFEDTPLTMIRQTGRQSSTWDYVGVVFDRCRQWAVRAVRRLVVYRSVTAEGSAAPYEIKDTPGSPLLFEEVGPISQQDAAERARPGGDPPGREKKPKSD